MTKPLEIICRQGDVLVLRAPPRVKTGESIPRERGNVVLAHGEATGHAHIIGARSAKFYRLRSHEEGGDSGMLSTDRVLEITAKAGVELRHEKAGQLTGGTRDGEDPRGDAHRSDPALVARER